MATRGPKPRTFENSAPTPEVAGDAWACPGHLAGDAAAAWKHLVDLLARAGNLPRTDPNLVEAYAINVAMLRAAQKEVSGRGIVLLGPQGGMQANPACAVVNAASMRIKAIVTDLGLCPSTSKFAPSAATPASNKWDGLLEVVG